MWHFVQHCIPFCLIKRKKIKLTSLLTVTYPVTNVTVTLLNLIKRCICNTDSCLMTVNLAIRLLWHSFLFQQRTLQHSYSSRKNFFYFELSSFPSPQRSALSLWLVTGQPCGSSQTLNTMGKFCAAPRANPLIIMIPLE